MNDVLSARALEPNVLAVTRSLPALQTSQNTKIPEELRCVCIAEILSIDPRPSFVIDLEDVQINGWRPVYVNDACTSALSNNWVVCDSDGAAPFKSWASDESIDRCPQYRYNGKLWISYNLRGRWRVISGTKVHDAVEVDPHELTSSPERISSPSGSWVGVSSRSSAFTSSYPTEDECNWVELLPSTAFVQKSFLTNDWNNTPLGPLAHWTYVLRRSTRFLLADPGAACLFWGKNHCCIFNENYASVMDAKRQAISQGRPASIVWPEIYSTLLDVFKEVDETKQAFGWKNVQFCIERNGQVVETYWDWNLIPLMEHRGVNCGFYSAIHETTQQYISNRRQNTMLASVHARDTTAFWEQIQSNFARNRWDAPIAAFYDMRRAEKPNRDIESINLPQRCILKGTLGIPDGHGAFPVCSDLLPHAEGIVPFLVEAAIGRESLILTAESRPEFFDLLNGVEWGGYEVPSHTVVIFCLRQGSDIIGFLLLGMNPCRTYNDEEHNFVETLDNHLSAALSSAVLIERSRENERELEKRLAQSIEQVGMCGARYRAITELSPLGMINIRPAGDTIYANRTWFDVTGHPPSAEYSTVSFWNVIHDDDKHIAQDNFDLMINKGQKRYYELRLKKKRYDPKIHRWHERWILCTGGPEYDEEGNIVSVIGCVTDITAQKLAENLQAESRRVAEEAKAAQEKFMDATSHEMRNPLSAILQSADEMALSLKEAVPQSNQTYLVPKQAIDTCVDAVDVITLCAQHQTRIVDDVLTMSKIDSNILEVTPVPAQPLRVVNETLQMYHGELQSDSIDTALEFEPGWQNSQIDWVYCDPARLKQILINLVSNAIKFTRQEAVRKITVKLTASTSKLPFVEAKDIKWFTSREGTCRKCVDMTSDPAWGGGEELYIGFAISDTGHGLATYERDKLFKRLEQANTLTHVHYGGSGLGFFISRELAEMHGGQVGIASKSGTGSAFAFYIKCRRALAPRPETPLRTNSGQVLAQVAGHVMQLPEEASNSHHASRLPFQDPVTAPKPAKLSLHVLVVEDNLVNQRVMTKQLIKAGCTVAIANHGQEALDYLTSTAIWSAIPGDGGKPIDIALVDIEMPVMNGLVCAKRIREYQTTGELICHLPLMAVTANARKEQVADCLAAGMDDVTIKPFKVADLLVKAQELIESLRAKASLACKEG